MTGTSTIAAAQQKLAELEASMNLIIGSLRASLVLVEEENRELRREALKRNTEFFTELEFAALVKVSVTTVKRLRRSGRLTHVRIGQLVRYTTAHLGQFEDQVDKGRPRSARSRLRRTG